MPNLLAHRLFIDNIIQCNSLEEKEIIALRLGTQGPDPMFYHGIIPWRSWHFIIALKKIGNKLHKENGRRFFLELKNGRPYTDYTDLQNKIQKCGYLHEISAFIFPIY